ncbi:hypothetical protein [Actinoplanes sp. URMC 104]|uniref:hypothetical protein n=1 Tax=Actinoplanes sp. URMC 104 TaxID=3423409 RepID=UPI003F1B7834
MRLNEEDALPVEKTHLSWNPETTRARVDGLCRNPALPDPLVLRILEHPAANIAAVMYSRAWSDELFDTLAAHPDVHLREMLARSGRATGEQRARMVDDPSLAVVMALLEGPYGREAEPLPGWAYRKLADRPKIRWLVPLLGPGELSDAAVAAFAELGDDELTRATPRPEPERITADQARAVLAGDSAWERVKIALEPGLPADVITALAADPDPDVRLYVSMRPELSEQERAAIDYRVSENDRLPRLAWVIEADGEQLQRCVSSAHPGVRRSAARNPRLTAGQIATLAADDDFPVRLLLCESQRAVPADLVVRTYLEARVVTRGGLLSHPALDGADLTRYADSPHWEARALAVLDPDAPAELIERLSHDEHPGVRSWVASDARLSRERLLELFDDPETTAPAAANPNLPVDLMEAVLEAPIDPGEPSQDDVLVLGHTTPTHEPLAEI